MVEGAQRQRTWAASIADGVTAEGAVEAAHRALVGVGARDLFGEAAAVRAQAGGLGRSPASGEI